MSTFLTSLNTAQKVKKFKTLTSVKKNLRSLTYFFGKQRKFFLLKKKKVFLKRKKILLKRKKILLQRKFSGERSQKKEGIAALLNLYANIHQKSAISKSAFRAVFTKVNSFAPSFAISELTKRAVFACPILVPKIEMHERNQREIFATLNYEDGGNGIEIRFLVEHERQIKVHSSKYHLDCFFRTQTNGLR